MSPRNISDKFTIIRNLRRFLEPGLISSTTFDQKLGFPTVNHKKAYKLIVDLIPNDWKHLLRAETLRGCFLIFYKLQRANLLLLIHSKYYLH